MGKPNIILQIGQQVHRWDNMLEGHSEWQELMLELVSCFLMRAFSPETPEGWIREILENKRKYVLPVSLKYGTEYPLINANQLGKDAVQIKGNGHSSKKAVWVKEPQAESQETGSLTSLWPEARCTAALNLLSSKLKSRELD